MANGDATVARLFLWAQKARTADWDACFTEELPRVYNFFRFRVGPGPVAEDLTSLTFEKAWVARERYRRDRAAFSTWLFTIARNVAVDHFRSVRVSAPLEGAAEVPAAGPTPEEVAARRSDEERLAQLLARRSERERELLALKYGSELDNRQIARMTGLSESNVGTILHRAVRALRADWDEGVS